MGQHYCMKYGSTRNVAVSFVDALDTGELLTGTPTVTATGLTITNKAVSTGSLTINGDPAAAGQAVQFSVSGGTAGTEYTITITVNTDSTPAQTFVEEVGLTVD